MEHYVNIFVDTETLALHENNAYITEVGLIKEERKLDGSLVSVTPVHILIPVAEAVCDGLLSSEFVVDPATLKWRLMHQVFGTHYARRDCGFETQIADDISDLAYKYVNCIPEDKPTTLYAKPASFDLPKLAAMLRALQCCVPVTVPRRAQLGMYEIMNTTVSNLLRGEENPNPFVYNSVSHRNPAAGAKKILHLAATTWYNSLQDYLPSVWFELSDRVLGQEEVKHCSFKDIRYDYTLMRLCEYLFHSKECPPGMDNSWIGEELEKVKPLWDIE